jgi:hypothetical protein
MKSNLLFGALFLTAALFAGCATSDDDAGESPVLDEQAAPAPARMTVDGSELGGPSIAGGYSCSSIGCNPNTGGGGTAYCRQVLEEPSAWCIRQGPGPAGWGLCCYP